MSNSKITSKSWGAHTPGVSFYLLTSSNLVPSFHSPATSLAPGLRVSRLDPAASRLVYPNPLPPSLIHSPHHSESSFKCKTALELSMPSGFRSPRPASAGASGLRASRGLPPVFPPGPKLASAQQALSGLIRGRQRPAPSLGSACGRWCDRHSTTARWPLAGHKLGQRRRETPRGGDSFPAQEACRKPTARPHALTGWDLREKASPGSGLANTTE